MTPDRQYNSVSRWQFPMLREICALPAGTYMPRSTGNKKDQRTFGSLYHRKWIDYRMGKGYYATKEGRKECHQYLEAESKNRNDPSRPLSHYFDPIAYALKTEKEPRRLHRVA